MLDLAGALAEQLLILQLNLVTVLAGQATVPPSVSSGEPTPQAEGASRPPPSLLITHTTRDTRKHMAAQAKIHSAGVEGG